MELKRGDVVQLSPEIGNQMFAACLMIVTDPKPWGAQGYVQALGENGQPGGQAYMRVKWEDMEIVGRAVWMVGGDDGTTSDPLVVSGPL